MMPTTPRAYDNKQRRLKIKHATNLFHILFILSITMMRTCGPTNELQTWSEGLVAVYPLVGPQVRIMPMPTQLAKTKSAANKISHIVVRSMIKR